MASSTFAWLCYHHPSTELFSPCKIETLSPLNTKFAFTILPSPGNLNSCTFAWLSGISCKEIIFPPILTHSILSLAQKKGISSPSLQSVQGKRETSLMGVWRRGELRASGSCMIWEITGSQNLVIGLHKIWSLGPAFSGTVVAQLCPWLGGSGGGGRQILRKSP